MAINQRGFTSQVIANTTPVYGIDRFRCATDAGSGTHTYSVQQFTTGSAPVSGYEAKQFARVVTNGQTLSNTYSLFIQSIEDVRTLAGQTATISFWAKAASGTPKVAVEIEQVDIGGAAPRKYMGQVTIGTTWARYSVTNTIPSISGTVGSGSKLEINLWVSGGSTYNALNGSMGIQSNTFDFWGIQVEEGSVATAFQTATGTIQGELSACQRYYYTLPYNYNAERANPYTDFLIMNTADQTGWARGVVQFPVTMRTSPSLQAPTAANYYILGSAGVLSVTSISIDNMTNASMAVVNAYRTGMSTGTTYFLRFAGNVTDYLRFSAEL
jgi:hypothetical protein